MSEPWRCKSCRQFMFNLDGEGYPAPGAPEPQWFSSELDELCSLCFDMESAGNTNYFRELDKARAERKQQVMKRGEQP